MRRRSTKHRKLVPLEQNGRTSHAGIKKTGDALAGTTASEPENLVKSSSGELRRTAIYIFLILATIRVIGAFANPISDCDETFNYWEPMHYLLFGFGFQTWEYSPEYALRSYAFLYPYAALAKFVKTLHVGFLSVLPESQFDSPKVLMFYGVRVIQGLLSACAETALVMAVHHRGERQVGALLFAGLATSPGMFRASVELLPSSFSMICVMGSFVAWISGAYGIAVIFIALASLLGWIFASVMGIPLAVDLLLRRGGFAKLVWYALTSGTFILVFMTLIDSWHFGKLVSAPLNHVLYNVFPKPGAGSHLYGEEPPSFYVINLFLNMPLPTVFFAIYPVLWIISRKTIGTVTTHRQATFGVAAYIALAIFISQPHKEERFLVPIYPLVALVGAFGLDSVTRLLLGNKPSRARRLVKFFLLCGYVIGGAIMGISRSGMQTWAYHAPLEVYSKLSDSLSTTDESVDLCVGAEWYRFPGSMFIPRENIRLRFLDTGFNGLLPLPFKPKSDGGTGNASAGFNDMNRAAKDQFYNGTCNIWVGVVTEKNYANRLLKGITHPYIIFSAPFLDNQKSPRGLRAMYIPGLMNKLSWTNYVAVSNATRLKM